MPSKYVAVAGVATHYLYTGTTTLPPEPPRYDRGHVWLFLHGAGGNAALWQRQLAALGDRHAAVALDFPGHGRSGSTEGLASIEAYADFTAAFAAAVSLPPAIVVGACMGGAVALELAVAHPERVKAVVAVNAAARPRFSPAAVDAWEAVTRGRAPQPFTTEAFSPATDFALMRELWMEQVKTDPRVRWRDMLACNDYDGTPRLAAVSQPALIVAGADDAVVPRAAAEELAAIRGARLECLDGAGHFAAVECAEAFGRLLGEFAAGVPGARPEPAPAEAGR